MGVTIVRLKRYCIFIEYSAINIRVRFVQGFVIRYYSVEQWVLAYTISCIITIIGFSDITFIPFDVLYE